MKRTGIYSTLCRTIVIHRAIQNCPSEYKNRIVTSDASGPRQGTHTMRGRGIQGGAVAKWKVCLPAAGGGSPFGSSYEQAVAMHNCDLVLIDFIDLC